MKSKLIERQVSNLTSISNALGILGERAYKHRIRRTPDGYKMVFGKLRKLEKKKSARRSRYESILSEAKNYTAKIDITNKGGLKIDKGTPLELSWVDYRMARVSAPGGVNVNIPATKLHKYVTGFSKPPSLNAMEKWMDSGVAKSVTGARVEPDGYGPDGAPSWLLALGYI